MPQSINDPLFERIDCVLLDLATEYRGPLIVKKAINDIFVEVPDNSELVDPVTYDGALLC